MEAMEEEEKKKGKERKGYPYVTHRRDADPRRPPRTPPCQQKEKREEWKIIQIPEAGTKRLGTK
jgi:hypothetical protein